MYQVEQEDLLTLCALPGELPAIEAATVGYLDLLEATLSSSQEARMVINVLRSFRQRYQEPLSRVQADLARDKASLHDTFITLQVTTNELLAFATAIIGYMRLLKASSLPSQERSAIINHVLNFQQRYLETLYQYR